MAKKREDEKPTNPASGPDAATGDATDAPRGRQGNAPACPYCSKPAKEKTAESEGKEAVVVLCKSERSDPFFTRYYCPTTGCPYSEKVPRPQLAQRIKRQEAAEGDFSAR